jgi:hypothetical protein
MATRSIMELRSTGQRVDSKCPACRFRLQYGERPFGRLVEHHKFDDVKT